MIVRQITNTNDWTFGKGKQNYKTGDLAIMQNVKTRIQSFMNDCFFDLEAGIDWFNLLEYGQKNKLIVKIQEKILETQGIIRLNSFDFDILDRVLTITFNVTTENSQSVDSNFTILL